jgi:hypothetical protein
VLGIAGALDVLGPAGASGLTAVGAEGEAAERARDLHLVAERGEGLADGAIGPGSGNGQLFRVAGQAMSAAEVAGSVAVAALVAAQLARSLRASSDGVPGSAV